MRILSILLLAAIAGIAVAQPQDAPAPSPNDYAARWPLQLPEGAVAGVFTLDPALHAAVQDPALGDLQAFDASGAAMPTARVRDDAAQWLRVGFASGGPADGAAGDAGVMAYAYALPVELAARGARVDVGAARGDIALQYRGKDGWRAAARWPAIGAARAPADGDPVDAVPALPASPGEAAFAAPVVATEWRVISGRALSPSPRLELSVQPARFAFLAQGTPPYQLAAGHAELRRTDAPEAAASLDRAAAATLGTRLAAPFVPIAPVVAATPDWLRPAAWSAAGACLLGMGWLLLRRRRGVSAAV